MSEEPTGSTQDWSPDKRAALALCLLRGEVSTQEAALKYALTPDEIEDLKARFLTTAEEALAARDAGARTSALQVDLKSEAGIGVWVCSLESQSLTPCLFIQSMCLGHFPIETSAPWSRDSPAPKPFRKSGAILPLHGECVGDPGGKSRLHLFGAKVADCAPIERRSILSDWKLPARIVGFVVLAESTGLGNRRSVSPRASRSATTRTLAWVIKQELPFVVAAVGYQDGCVPEDAIREALGLPPEVPLILGPAPVRRSKPKSRTGQSDIGGAKEALSLRDAIVSLVSGGTHCFDPAYARELLDALDKQIAAVTP